MKNRSTVKLLSFVLAFLAFIMILPFGALRVNAVDDDVQTEERLEGEAATNETSVEDVAEPDETDDNSAETVTEEETEVLYYEFECEDSVISAPPMTEIGGLAQPNAAAPLPDGVYEIENVGNDNYYMSLEGGYAVAGYNMIQQNYGSNTPLANFSRVSLFKVTRVGDNQYVIRSMLNNRMSPARGSDIDINKFETGYISTDDAATNITYTILQSGGVYTIHPYGSMSVIAAPNTTVSGEVNADAAQLILTTQSAAGNRGKWRFTPYTGNARYGFAVTRTGGMGNGLVKGKSGNIWIKGWSTVIGANTPYLSVTPDTAAIAKSDWDEYAGGVLLTGKKCGDCYVKAEIRSGDSQTLIHSTTYTYTVIPDIVGDTAYVQNAGTSRYIDLEQVNYVPTDIVQQWSFHTGTQAQWIFELGGNGYLKIKSVKTGKYIGVDSSNTTKVKQYSTVTDYTLWKLTETSNGRYKFSCKASALSGKVLCAPTSASGNGADLTMLAYVNDADYKDEWKIYHLQNIIGGVPTSLQSNDIHYCIPCAITNIAGYWSNNGYSQFGCATASNQESAAVAVQAKMNKDSGSDDGYTKNAYIPNGFAFFTCTSAGKEYSLESQNIWQSNSAFSIDLIINEIDAGRPVMLGYGTGAGTPYVKHMTVCTGYDFAGDDVYVYVSDAHNSTYQVHLFNGTTYNDFIATVKCTIESN